MYAGADVRCAHIVVKAGSSKGLGAVEVGWFYGHEVVVVTKNGFAPALDKKKKVHTTLWSAAGECTCNAMFAKRLRTG